MPLSPKFLKKIKKTSEARIHSLEKIIGTNNLSGRRTVVNDKVHAALEVYIKHITDQNERLKDQLEFQKRECNYSKKQQRNMMRLLLQYKTIVQMIIANCVEIYENITYGDDIREFISIPDQLQVPYENTVLRRIFRRVPHRLLELYQDDDIANVYDVHSSEPDSEPEP